MKRINFSKIAIAVFAILTVSCCSRGAEDSKKTDPPVTPPTQVNEVDVCTSILYQRMSLCKKVRIQLQDFDNIAIRHSSATSVSRCTNIPLNMLLNERIG